MIVFYLRMFSQTRFEKQFVRIGIGVEEAKYCGSDRVLWPYQMLINILCIEYVYV